MSENKWLNENSRRWLYNVVMALAVIFIGFQGWQAVTTENWVNLINAVFGMAGGGSALLARKNIHHDE